MRALYLRLTDGDLTYRETATVQLLEFKHDVQLEEILICIAVDLLTIIIIQSQCYMFDHPILQDDLKALAVGGATEKVGIREGIGPGISFQVSVV